MGVTKPYILRLEVNLKDRIITQCQRLNITQSAFIKMALVRFLEEEEKTQAIVLQR